MRARPDPRLRDALDALVRRYDHRWLDSDPLRFPRSFPDPGDREVVAVLAALLAYGRVAAIDRAVSGTLGRLGPAPARTVEALAPAALARRLAGVRHRWTTGGDLAWLLSTVGRIRREEGSLGAFLAARAQPGRPLRSALAAWRAAAAPERVRDRARRRARAFLLPDAEGPAASKRLLLLARWCVRPDDGLDLGLWTSPRLAPADLLIPLDVHVHRTALDLGLTRRPQADARAVDEVTAALRRFDPVDPVRYDFALARAGILGRCRHRPHPPVCTPCPLRAHCRAGRRVRPAATSRSPGAAPAP